MLPIWALLCAFFLDLLIPGIWPGFLPIPHCREVPCFVVPPVGWLLILCALAIENFPGPCLNSTMYLVSQ
ncbi:hypothetical protein QBC46DRAFT_388836 [Diplogelasinospora grovesii]|uniref:Uncharacterized protein n=1 Tax=Diplogelasinospora grovesii TaxID=303347 RepID=A0AAN6N648_9PEZI|nr:hypothetical protein QBC46DRAFT_388836 [Diplogelasinospora grovesii]